jgi:hypothetical protein
MRARERRRSRLGRNVLFKFEAQEATPIRQRALQKLLRAAPASSDPAMRHPRADFRTACNDLIVNAETLIQHDVAGPPLDHCFDLAVGIGITLPGLTSVRDQAYGETAISVGAKMIKSAIIQLTLAHSARVIANMTFVSRDDVDAIRQIIQGEFGPAEEEAADDMDQMTYRALIALHASVINFLTTTARPLPQMLYWQFYQVMSTLALAQRLYYDAGRADELLKENHIVHPAFSPLIGRALSS